MGLMLGEQGATLGRQGGSTSLYRQGSTPHSAPDFGGSKKKSVLQHKVHYGINENDNEFTHDLRKKTHEFMDKLCGELS